MPSNGVWWALATLLLLLGVAHTSAQQLQVNTPGGMRSVPVPASTQSGDPESAGACSPGKDPGCVEPSTSEPVIPVELQVLTGDVLYESLFPNLEAISEQDKQILMSNMMALQNGSASSASGGVVPGSVGAAGVGASRSPLIGDTPQVDPVSALASGGLDTPSHSISNISTTPTTVALAGVGHASVRGTVTDGSGGSNSSLASDIPSDVASMPVLGSSGQSASQVDTAVGTVAATLPVMGQYAQVIVSSLKMLPINAEQFNKVSGTGAAALSWEQDLEESLIAATANATTIPAAQIETKLTCVINLGLELPEPPAAYAAAAATAMANKISALANDASVLVGVSLIRLGRSSSSKSGGAVPAAAAAVNSAWLDHSAAAYNSTVNGSRSGRVSSTTRKLAAAAAAASSTHSTATSPPSTGSALMLLSVYGVDSPASAVEITTALQKNCPGLLKYGSTINGTVCGADILTAYVSAINAAAAGDTAAKRLLLQDEVGVRTSNASFTVDISSIGNSSSGNGTAAAPLVMGTTSGSSSNFSAGYIRVRQQPEVNIIISQAVGITAAQPAADVVLKLQAFSSSFTLPQVLGGYGLAVSQAGIPQIVEIQSAGGSTADGSPDSATPLAAPADTSKTTSASGANSVVIGVSVTAGLAVTAVSAAAVAIVVVRQRARAAKARAAAAGSGQLNRKHRKGGKAKGFQSKYLPTTVFSSGAQGPDNGAGSSSSSNHASSSSSTATPAGQVAVQLPSSPAAVSPILSPTGTLLLPQTGSAAAAGTGANAVTSVIARSVPLQLPVLLSPAVSGGQPVGQQLTRGDSVSSAVRFDLEVDNGSSSSHSSSDGSSSSSDGSESEVEEGGCCPQQQGTREGDACNSSSSTLNRSQGGRRLRLFGHAERDHVSGNGTSSSRMEAVLPRTASKGKLSETSEAPEVAEVAVAAADPQSKHQHEHEVHVIQSIFHSQLRHRATSPCTGDIHSQHSGCGSRNCSSSGCRFSNSGLTHSRSSQGGSAAATPRWWSAAAEASIALMSAATAAAAAAEPGMAGSAAASELVLNDLEQQQEHSAPIACQQQQQQEEDEEDASCTCTNQRFSSKDVSCPRLFSRSLSASSLQVFEAAAAAATAPKNPNSSSILDCITPTTPVQLMQQHLLLGGGSSGSSGGPSCDNHNTHQSSNLGTPLVHVVCSDQLSSWGSSNGAAASSGDSFTAAIAGSKAGEKLLQHKQHQEAVVLRPLPKPLVSPFQMAANVSFTLDSL